MHPKKLADLMPRAGVVLNKHEHEHRHYVLNRDRYDKQIRKALANAGFTTRTQIDKALADLCTKAMHREQYPERQKWAHIKALKGVVPWAAKLDATLFAEFFFTLVRARQRWNVHPRQPLNKSQHSLMAKELDMLIQVYRDEYAKMDFGFRSLLDEENKKKIDEMKEKEEDEMAALMGKLDTADDENGASANTPVAPVNEEMAVDKAQEVGNPQERTDVMDVDG
ncbi:hypothetical protein GGR57DRAFT_516180 [Xylariaceae sp. FL1272]|nr:hypothetical protein GGR57DRAFT_516180 [Xylariaceae sp. FL1272]